MREDGDGTCSWQTVAGGGGEANVQSDWNETDTAEDDYIKNKPTLLQLGTTSTTALAGNTAVGDANVQSDWDAVSGDAQILNKPTLAPSDADNTANSETSHADVVVDGDFASEGLMKRGGSTGTYSIVTDNSGNWDTAYGWNDHSQAGYLTGITADSINDTHIDFGTGTNQVSTADIPEDTNLYYTNTRADARVSAASLSTLSDVASTLPTDTQVLTWDNSASNWKPADASGGGGGGKVIQVKSMSTTTSTSTTSSSNQNTACTLSITLTDSANKVLVMTTGQIGADTSYREGAVSLYRGSTNILSDFVVTTNPINNVCGFPAPCTYLDTPGTSSVTYRIKCRQAGTSGAAIFNAGGYNGDNTTRATMVLMEIEV